MTAEEGPSGINPHLHTSPLPVCCHCSHWLNAPKARGRGNLLMCQMRQPARQGGREREGQQRGKWEKYVHVPRLNQNTNLQANYLAFNYYYRHIQLHEHLQWVMVTLVVSDPEELLVGRRTQRNSVSGNGVWPECSDCCCFLLSIAYSDSLPSAFQLPDSFSLSAVCCL